MVLMTVWSESESKILTGPSWAEVSGTEVSGTEVSGVDFSGADSAGTDFLHLGLGLKSVLSASGPVEADSVLLPPAKGEALESMGGMNDWYTALAIDGTNSGSEKTAGTWWLCFSWKSTS